MMKQILLIILWGLFSCPDRQNNTSEIIVRDTMHAELPSSIIIDTLENIPDEAVKKEYYKSAFAYSHHGLIKNEFPFNTWLTECHSKDSLRIINTQADSALIGKNHIDEKYVFNLTDEWQLRYLIKRGWYELGLDRTTVNRCYVSKANKFTLQGADLVKIFRTKERWTLDLNDKNQLIIRFSHWYLNGNQTSWAYEIIYIFTK
jgi:hypothetical protein